MIVIAKIRFARITPRKARYLREIVLNKEAHSAIRVLEHIPNKSALIIKKLVKSALANAEKKNPEQKNWYIKNLTIDEGPKMKRLRSAPMGRAVMIMKRLSHITVILEDYSETKKLKGSKNGSKGKSNRS